MFGIGHGRSIFFILLIIINFTLFGCGGGIEGTGVDTNLKGTAAVGNPIGLRKIIIKGSNGNKLETQSEEDGSFNINVSDLSAPYILWIEYKNLFSVAFKTGIVNIHPLTDLITRNWFAVQGTTVQAEFKNSNPAITLPTKDAIDAIEKKINNLTSLAEFSIKNEFALFNDPFTTNKTGFDGFLDLLDVRIFNNKINISILDLKSRSSNKIINNLALNFDFTTSNIKISCATGSLEPCVSLVPTTPAKLRVAPSLNNKITLLWAESQDNSGIKGYNIYRDNQLIYSTPYLRYQDENNLINNTEYCYAVAAIDGDNNVSEKSAASCTITMTNPEITPPIHLQNLSVNVVNGIAELSWTARDDINLEYSIYASNKNDSGDLEYMEIGQTFESVYFDKNIYSINSQMSICYHIDAYLFTIYRGPYIQRAPGVNEVCIPTIQDNQAPITTAIPAAGTYTSPQTVKLICDDGQGASGCIHTVFSLDGNEIWPIEEDYFDEIPIYTTTTIRYYSEDSAGNIEQIKSETYTIIN